MPFGGGAAPAPAPAVAPAPAAAPVAAPVPAVHLETVIGQKWIGWVAVVLILFAAGFFLKYAFENRWIGELGRVTLGVIVGLVFAWVGFQRYRVGWRYLSQVLTGGGIIPKEDLAELKKLGTGELFGPGTPIEECVRYVREEVKARRVREGA